MNCGDGHGRPFQVVSFVNGNDPVQDVRSMVPFHFLRTSLLLYVISGQSPPTE